MDRQARTGEIVLVKSSEMTGKTQTLWWLGGEGVKTTDNKYIGPVELRVYNGTRKKDHSFLLSSALLDKVSTCHAER